jgi:hypothetical protein
MGLSSYIHWVKIFIAIIILPILLSGCFRTEEKISIETDGSLIYTQTTTIKRNDVDKMYQMFKQIPTFKANEMQVIINRAINRLIEKYKKIKGVDYVAWDNDLSLDNSSKNLVSKFELKINSFLSFPKILKKIRETKLNDYDMQMILSSSSMDSKARKQFSQMIKDNDFNIETPFVFQIKKKYDRKYKMRINTRSSLSDLNLNAEEKMGLIILKQMNPKYSILVSTPKTLYTNMNVGVRNDYASTNLSGGDLVNKKFNGIIEFEIGYLAFARIKSIELLQELK